MPNTQTKIEAAILIAKRAAAVPGAPVQRVVVAPGIIDVLELRVPTRVILVGSGALGSPTTTLRLKAGSQGRTVLVGGGSFGESFGNGIENIIIDGNRANQPADTYITVGGKLVPNPRPAVLTLLCSNCSANYVRVENAMYDGVLLSSGQNITVNKSSASRTGRNGFFTSDSVNTVRIVSSQAQDTGLAWRHLGGGAGFGGGGKNVEINSVVTDRTNGDGVAAYGSFNLDYRVINSVFRTSKNHCVHLGGDRPVISGNKCYSPRHVGYYLANNFRAGFEDERDAVGGRILNNYVEKSGVDGVKVQWYVADTLIQGNTVNTSFNHNFGVYDSKGVTVTANVGRWPGTGRSPGPQWCHLKISNSQVSHFKNNFAYTGVTRPPTC